MVPVLAFSQSTSHTSPASDLDALATCPACHSAHPSLTMLAVSTGATWQCARCFQRWDAIRLAAVAGYRAWEAENTVASPVRD